MEFFARNCCRTPPYEFTLPHAGINHLAGSFRGLASLLGGSVPSNWSEGTNLQPVQGHSLRPARPSNRHFLSPTAGLQSLRNAPCPRHPPRLHRFGSFPPFPGG